MNTFFSRLVEILNKYIIPISSVIGFVIPVCIIYFLVIPNINTDTLNLKIGYTLLCAIGFFSYLVIFEFVSFIIKSLKK